ncbi:hypothetical protein SERLA73DRAFT_120441 [Serpula lacrymans var. lacrymans S7.3]|uniref:Small-subunit processome Utp12 domain-containing protein n=1 Tax=Serpula lacrymans var. lacrymans (strain S7.3) TaxID=936435 RepID=F8PNR7_SERL3|nr:hypothetical protein SERLA73DRAFT_120441 [Serpula lacrymans var. lacrymans S7.3]
MASSPAPAKKARTKASRKKVNTPRTDLGEVVVEDEPSAIAAQRNVRYAESSSLAVHSGTELGQDQAMEDLAARDVDGNLDTDLAELSLGQRLTALNGTEAATRIAESDSDVEDDAGGVSRQPQKHQETPNLVPANSLTRTLIQALHSSDSRLLETCLAHSDPTLIRNTVRRLPSQLAVPLLSVCVERLGRGSRAANMKGGGGGASSQRGMGLITWVKAVLVVHSGYLMTLPDLVVRLSGLHATLTSRLALQDSLLALNGRLDMVLSQIEMRSSTSPAILTSNKDKGSSGSRTTRLPTRYVEGESDNEEEQMDAEVAVESGEDEGSIEDVELGGESQEDDDDDDDEGESDEEDSDGEGPMLNGFIDDEAEEFDDDEQDDGDSE